MKFIVYADIHHDEHAAKCLTLKDTLEIERQVFQRAADGGFDFIIFAGDRFLKREPKDEVKVLADECILDGLADQKKGFAYFHLVGNHDRVDNTLGWHTATALSIQLKTLEYRPGVMTSPGTYLAEELPVAVHALPAGYQFDASKYALKSMASKLNIFVFHDIVRGATSDSEGKHVFDEGIPVSDFDLPEFDRVYAGDIHVPQKFHTQNTKGGYVGAVLQRTRADSNQARGWLEVEAERVDNQWVFKTELVPTRNFFTRFAFDVNDTTTYTELTSQIDDQWVTDQAVEVRLRGCKADVDKLADEPQWRNYTDIVLARRFDVLREYQTEKQAAVVDLSSTQNPVEDLKLYIDSGFADVGTLSEDKLVNILERANG